ncbi:MAG: hypothetical protein ACOX2M_03405 [Fastidiosipilaceae bacterium]|jgi:predicted RNase H-like HicB family nuclease
MKKYKVSLEYNGVIGTIEKEEYRGKSYYFGYVSNVPNFSASYEGETLEDLQSSFYEVVETYFDMQNKMLLSQQI